MSHSAEQGHADAQFNLALRFSDGVGVEGNEFDAFFWLDLAAKGGNDEAIAARTLVANQIAPDHLAEIERGCAALAWLDDNCIDLRADCLA